MILIRFGRWSHLAGRWFIWRRIYHRGYEWTPFCRVQWRYPLYKLTGWWRYGDEPHGERWNPPPRQ